MPYDTLLNGDALAKKIALDLMESAIESVDPYRCVKNTIEFNGNERTLKLKTKKFRARDIYVISIGKAACPMAKAVEEIFGDKIKAGVAVTKYGYAFPLESIKVIEAGHPLPDEHSLEAAEAGIEIAEMAGEDDILLVLISGGGSALFTLPEDGIALEDKILTNKLLLESGAKIHEINTVRKHISKVKGGKLAKRVRGTVLTLIISDVVGDDLASVASGLTVKDPTTFQDAYRILRSYNLWEELPEGVREHIEKGLKGEKEETLKEDLPNVHNILIANNTMACEAAMRRSLELGYSAHILTTTLEGESKDVALALGSIIEEIYHKRRPFSRPCILIAGGEMTVTLKGDTIVKGGPNQEFALSISRKIKGLRGVAVLSMDTDGTDGPTNAAGGLVDSYTFEFLQKMNSDVEDCLRRHDSYNALERGQALLITGPTRTNVNSLVIIVFSQ